MADAKSDRIQAWVIEAAADAGRRGLVGLLPIIETLGLALAVLRAADWNDDAGGTTGPDSRPGGDGR